MTREERDHLLALCVENDRKNMALARKFKRVKIMHWWFRGQAKAYRRIAVRLRNYENIT